MPQGRIEGHWNEIPSWVNMGMARESSPGSGSRISCGNIYPVSPSMRASDALACIHKDLVIGQMGFVNVEPLSPNSMTHISGSQEPRPSWIKKSRDGIDWKIWIDSLLRHPPTNNREFYLLQTILILAISRTGSLAKIEHTNPSARASLRSASVSICKSTFCALKFRRLWTIWTG